MFLIHKKGDTSDLGNFRGIMILPVVVKLYMSMLLSRVAPVLDEYLRPSQNGFRKGRSTSEHILAVRRLMEETVSSPVGEIFTHTVP